MRNTGLLAFIFLLLQATAGSVQSRDVDEHSLFNEFLNKDEIIVLITDSGLGGIAVCADIENRFRSEHPFKSVKIIYCNALPESDYGYNNMTTTEEKVRVFSAALDGMTKWYSPDIILIACNTLSVLYDQTDYFFKAKIPVISIVDLGVEMMTDALKKDPTSSIIIFGTETTIEARSHLSLLVKNGITENRIVTQACPDLAGEIQSDASSDAVATMIEFYSDDAVKIISATAGTVYAGLCCTHFGYASEHFLRAVNGASKRKTIVIDPTRSMSGVLFPVQSKKRFASTTVSVNVVSRAAITQQETRSIGTLIMGQSVVTANSLQNYTLKKDLFEFQRK